MRKRPECSSRPAAAADGLFDPVETDILRRYFGLKTTLDRASLLGDTEDEETAADKEPGRHAAAFGVRLDHVEIDANHEDPALARAVARICLHVVGRRPAVRAGASPLDTLARASDDNTPENAPYPAPLLFGVDWAMCNWPEWYFIVLVPGFDRYVVVKTSDEECCGGAWLALGWFRRGKDAVPAIRAILKDWWSFQAGHTQPRWESFLQAGVISADLANGWADAVWAEYEAEEEEDHEEEEDQDEEGQEGDKGATDEVEGVPGGAGDEG